MPSRTITRARPRLRLFLALALLACLLPGQAAARWIDLGGDPVAVTLVEQDGPRSLVEIRIGGFEAEPVSIAGETWYQILLAGESRQEVAGLPALPDVRRSLLIPGDREMALRIVEADYTDLPDMPVAPSKGHLPRSVDPATVPYTFGDFYAGDSAWPAEPAQAEAPYILRDCRGLLVDANVFQYLPASRSLRVWTRLLVEVAPVGPAKVNPLLRPAPERMDRQFAKLYAEHFLNYRAAERYTPVLEDGGILVICYDAFLSGMQPYVDWKLQKGIHTEMVGLSSIGSTYTQVAAYIQDAYDTWQPGYVLLVGDAAQMPRHEGSSDPCYSLVDGGDNYPDLFVGRFSAETLDQVATQVERTVHYERDVTAAEVWPQYGMGVASNQGDGIGDDGEADNVHMDVIRQKLLAYGYIAVDQIYDPTGTAAMVTNGLNEGRGIVNYCGHGSVTSWGSTGFSNTHINALVNDNMLPFICTVACNNGTFTSGTCFAEAWLRATHSGVPTGAIACYASYISQSWAPPMCAEDEAIDLLVADAMRTVGGLYFNGSCQMMDEYGASGVSEFKAWTIFGDPSLCVRTKQASALTVGHTGVLLIGMTDYDVEVLGTPDALCALYADGVLYGSAVTDAAGLATIHLADPPDTPMTLTLTVTAYNAVTEIDAVDVLPPSGPYLVYEGVTVLDAGGDGDGVLDAGETDELEIELENVGVEAATNVTCTLSSADPYVSLAYLAVDYGDIPAGGFSSGDMPFPAIISGAAPDGHLIHFTIHAMGDQGSWDADFSLPVQAPVLGVRSLAVNDASWGNASGTADAGETFLLQAVLENTGHSDAVVLTGTLSCMSSQVVIHGAAGTCDLVAVGGVGLMGTFEVEILGTCPEPSLLDFHLAVAGPSGFAQGVDFDLPVGGWFDDFETDLDWAVGAPGDGASSGMWERDDPIGTEYNGYVVAPEDDHTPAPGVLCFVTGNGGGAAGDDDVDGGPTTLLSPVFSLGGATSAQLSYWRWFTNDRGNAPGEDPWIVQVTADGSTWVDLENTVTSNASWVQMSFDLTAHVAMTNQVQVRFVATDIGSGSLVEAGVDDVLLEATYPITTDAGDAPAPARLALSCFPNPFNPKAAIRFDLPAAGPAELAVYDVRGRRVRTLFQGELVAGTHEATWDGRDDGGRALASGIYFARVTAQGRSLTRKLTLLK
ncbi:MAG: T9SS type A sorting domain-containing protein [Candidatus Krumholzibacteriota bacterium]|nr:T9SS type A sorting domain-containing protein [Candidatus Krumholzibacteriota bacterium]